MKKAFTLAEVLITLGIIGVVAALTMPSLIQKYKEKETVAKLKKVYSILSQAYILAQSEYGDASGWYASDDYNTNVKILVDNLRPYLNITKDCGFGKGCWTPGPVKDLIGGIYSSAGYDGSANFYKIILADGSSIAFQGNRLDGTYGAFLINVSGLKGSNTRGKDIFDFQISFDKIVPMDAISQCNRTSPSVHRGGGCTAWVIYNENMDYLHCDDLSWEGKTKCN